ncbi:terminase small subunit [Enterobacter asburiae]|uniref:terminase small subunit n=1 Tax=Enterobacter asburiae TaxID=61645 RepID=UPI00301C7CE2
MARMDLDEVQAWLLADHHETGITPKDRCACEGLSFASAKRYIKIADYKYANSQNLKCKKEPTGQRPNAAAGLFSPRTNSTDISPSDYGISEQQALVADHIVQGKTRVDAYIQAGYVVEGNTAYSNASRLLRNARGVRYIHALRNARQKSYSVELDDLITQLTTIMNADPNALS